MAEGMIEKIYNSKAIVKSNGRQPSTTGPKAASSQVVFFIACTFGRLRWMIFRSYWVWLLWGGVYE
jgi:hypothetical protein